MNNFVAYYRVSTQKQGRSGLGLDSQKKAVLNFLSVDDVISCEFTDIESGKNNNRPNLLKAIDICRQSGAILLIAKLDRLSRNAAFIFKLRDSQVKFKCVDMPEANSVTIGIMAVLAQDERERISIRTKAALAEKKSQGFKLGNPENLTSKARIKGMEQRIRNARLDSNNRKATAMIVALEKQGKTFYTIANELNNLGFCTRRGNKFQQNQVQRLFNRFVEEQKQNI
ncbi:resolvase-like protein [Nonlabens dokdonensis]|jgi:DNA invertase Pin-like site-specific DNA recombinase|uniref:Resolvase, N-terminal n=2 Tax=Nonlabens dokdonensis TaxID=328515 RepID=L7W701_NONDD|nr:recombinase family protein [Nonlabens dokdonensis]AGC75972.1 resolvase, N-terminal [Nonlabens dokdonensis DSW-6]PZX43649.1 resolvase-like protein [Nonlabens dokdonensis]